MKPAVPPVPRSSKKPFPEIDPADDGPEVEAIRREMQIAAGGSLHWTDHNGHALSHVMTTAEASEKGIEL